MSIETLVTTLEAANFTTYYGTAPVGAVCPYVVIADVTHPNAAADNQTHAHTTSLTLQLIEAETHDLSLIVRLEQVLDMLSLPYSSEDIQEPSELVCETHYNINFYGGNSNG